MPANIITYFGGKNASCHNIYKFFPSHNEYRKYGEYYGGSGAVLINKTRSEIEIFNDLDGNVVALYKVIADETLWDTFREKCNASIVHNDLRREYHQKLKEGDLDILTRAYYFWYVNRTSRNGLYSKGFVNNFEIVGGMGRAVKDFFNSIDCLPELHQRLKYVVFENQKAIKLIKKYKKDKDMFNYLDPPYHHDTRSDCRYPYDMTNKEHEKLIAEIIKPETKAKFLISGYSHDLYDVLLNHGFRKEVFNTFIRIANGFKKAEECVWFNYTPAQQTIFDIHPEVV